MPNNEYIRSLEFLNTHSADILASYEGVYKLDKDSGEWKKVYPQVPSFNRQAVDIYSDQLYFYDRDVDNACYLYTGQLDSREKRVLMEMEYCPYLIAISNSGKKLAYTILLEDESEKTGITVLDTESCETHQVYRGKVYSISWSPDSAYLFFETEQAIMRLSMEDGSHRIVAYGHWVKALDNQSIVYVDWTQDHSGCFKRDIAAGSEVKLSDVDGTLYAVDSDTTGRFVLTANLACTGLFTHGILLRIHDTTTGKVYPLPVFKYVTSCVFLQTKNLGSGLPASE